MFLEHLVLFTELSKTKNLFSLKKTPPKVKIKKHK